MRDWTSFVRRQLNLTGLRPEREARIIRELATQLEDFYREALGRGATDIEADAHACRQISDWKRMSRDLRLADRQHARPPIERLADRIEALAPTKRSWFAMSADAIRDARYALRQLRKTPGFAIVAVLTLALGIGATSAIFSVINGVLLRPLPFPEADRLVRVNEIVPQYGRFSVAPATFLDWRKQATAFERISTFGTGSATLAGSDGPERVTTATVSWDLFDLLRVSPALGRTFSEAEDAPGKNSVVVLSYGLWQRRFGGDPGVFGRALTLSGEPVTIVGVMPRAFFYPSRETELWQPIALNPANATRGGHFLGVIARLKPGVSVAAASAELKMISERLAVQYPAAS